MARTLGFSALPALLILAGCLFDSRKEASRGSIVENEATAGVLYLVGGAPAVGARVALFSVNHIPDSAASGEKEPEYQTRTDSLGAYRIDSVPEGKYNILGELDGVYSFQDSVQLFDEPVKLPADTLDVPGSLSGIVRLQPNHDPRTATIQILGTDRFGNVDGNGRFTIGRLAAGAYDIRVVTTLAEYTPLYVSMEVRSGAKDSFPDTLRPDYTGIPVVTGIKAEYDTLSGVTTLTWDPVKYPQLSDYLIYRNLDSDLNSPTAPLARIQGMRFEDTLPASTWRAEANSPWPKFEYRIRVRNKSDQVGLNYGFALVEAVAPSQASTVIHLDLLGSRNGEASIGDSVVLIARYSNPTRKIRTVRWFLNGGTDVVRERLDSSRAGVDSLVVSRNEAGSVTARVEVTDASGVSRTDSSRISIVRDAPMASLSAGDFVLAGSPLALSAKGSSDGFGRIVKWEWDIGGSGGFVSTGGADTVIQAPAKPDSNFTVVLRVSDDDGQTGLDTLRIRIVNWRTVRNGLGIIDAWVSPVNWGLAQGKVVGVGSYASTREFDAGADTWKKTERGIVPMNEMLPRTLKSVGDHLLLFPDYRVDDAYLVQSYDIASGAWSFVSAPSFTLSSNRSRPYPAGVDTTNGKVYLFGGPDSLALGGILFGEYDVGGNTWRKRASLPDSLFNSVAVQICGGEVFFYGYKSASLPLKSHLWRYKPDTDQWSIQAPPPFTGTIVNTVVLGDDIVFQVEVTDKQIFELWSFKTSANAWSKISGGTQAQYESRIARYQSKLVSFIVETSGHTSVPDPFGTREIPNFAIKVEAYDIENGKWEVWPPIKADAFYGITPISLENEILLMDDGGQAAIHYYP